MKLVIDLETVPNLELYTSIFSRKYLSKIDGRLSDPARVAEAQLKQQKAMALDVWLSKIVCISCLVIGQTKENPVEAIHKELCLFEIDNEKKLLQDFWEFVQDLKAMKIFSTITFNGIQFDLPKLFLKSMQHGIRPPCATSLKKWSFVPHLDIMQCLSYWGILEWRSLDFYNFIFSDKETRDKLEKEKSESENVPDIYDMYSMKNYDGIKNKCLTDCKKVFNIYSKIKDYFV